MKPLLFLLVLSLLLTSVLCDKKETRTSAKPEELGFTIRTELLAPAIVDSNLGFSWAPPRDWQPLPASVRETFLEAMQKNEHPDDPLTAQPVHIFIEKQNRLFCTISSFPRLAMGDSLITRLQQNIAAKFPQANIKQGVFAHNGFTLDQFRIITNERIIYKFFIAQPDHKSFLLDYIIPRSDYEKHLQAIESSVGSLKPLSLKQ